MLKLIIELLQLHNWEVGSENIEIAKGKNELPKNFKGAIKNNKRQWRLRKL
jgi:hypothetical protein